MMYKGNVFIFSIKLVVCVILLERIRAKQYHPSHLHKQMNKKELSRFFGVDNHDEVPEYDITNPTKVDKHGAFLSHHLSESADDSATNTDSEKLHYNVNAFGKHFNLHLKKNRRLLSRNLEVEVLGHKGNVLRKEKVKNCFYHGHSKNHRHSRAALSNCNNLAGVIDVEDQSYFIEPLPQHLSKRFKRSDFDENVSHIIYRRTTKKRQQRSIQSQQSHKQAFCGTEDNPMIRLQRSVSINPNSKSGGDETDPEKYIETMVVVDEKMCDFHGEDAAKQFSLAACNIASGLLKDYTIGANPINLVITKMQIHTVPQEGLLINKHAMNSLSSFGKWAERNTVPDDSDPQHYDYATLFTRYDICKDKNQPCDTLGVSNVGGMCQFPNSVSICEDNGLMVGKTLAHETGHALGMNHDVRPFCGDSKKMMSLDPEGSDAYEWSKCSRMFLRQFLDSSNSRCLEDKPLMKRSINLEMFNEPGLLYDADQQCSLAFGDGSKYCRNKSPEERCSKLWCSTSSDDSGKCRGLNQPMAEGTPCGKTKWCKRGSCVDKKSEGPQAIDGGWSSWSKDYTECTRTCSNGVQYRTRLCNNPLPAKGGKFCEGEHREYKLCNTKPCPETRNFRDVQCEEKNKEMFNDKFFEWEWRSSNIKNKCTLGCFIKNTNKGYAFGNVEDGTNCDEDSANKCINGECVHVGCDGIIGSSAELDRCGVCNGDGGTCQFGNSSDEVLKEKLAAKYRKQGKTFKKTLLLLKSLGYNVPQNYELANTDELVSQFHWASVRTGCSVTCGQGSEMQKSECRRTDDGSPVMAKKCDMNKKPPEETTQCEMKQCQPEWRTDRWEDCSKSCNGGRRKRHVKCVQMIGDQIEFDVEDDMCDPATKPPTQEICNAEECKAEWVAQPFGQCSTSCGRGVQKRKIICQKTSKDGDTVIVDKEKCANFIKPTSEEFCNVHNPCPGEGQCGGSFHSNKGYVTSPGFPEPYPNEKECIHSITVPEDKVVKLSFKSFQLNGALNSQLDGTCSGDFLRITDGDCNKRGADTHYCGDSITAPFLSTRNKLCMKFFSDESLTSKGFNASFEAVDHPARPKDPCGSYITASIGLIMSPNYPEQYPRNEICNTTIKTLEGPIQLNFQYFDVGNKQCDKDYLLLKGDSKPTKLCGSHLPKTYIVNGNTLHLSFVSGETNNDKLGFVATYTSGKDSRLAGSKSTILGKEAILTNGNSTQLPQTNNDLVDSLRDTIPRPSTQEPQVNFIPITPSSSDSKEVSKEEVSGDSNKVPGFLAKATTAQNKTVEATNVTASTGAATTRQQILRPLQTVLEQHGALMTRGQCPHPDKLSCINLLYSFPCVNNNVCALRGMDCCPTSCSYGPSMCVPKVWRECPLLTPYTDQTLETCESTADCNSNSICCIDMLGRRYCHKRKEID